MTILSFTAYGQNESERAVLRVNQYRKLDNLDVIEHNEKLKLAAEAHARYLALHNVMGHYESPGARGFTGRAPWDRTRKTGYDFPGIYENVSYLGNPEGAVDSWIDSVYHRFPIMMPKLLEAGYGRGTNSKKSFDVMNYAVASPGTDEIKYSIYPTNGQYGVPIAFGGESPNPRPDRSNLSGYPVTITVQPWRDRAKLILNRFNIYDDSGNKIDSWVIHPGNDNLLTTSAACIPKRKLERYTIYKVEADFTIKDHGNISLQWSFTTGLRNVSAFFKDELLNLNNNEILKAVQLLEAGNYLEYLDNLLQTNAFFTRNQIPTLWINAQSLGVGHPWQMKSMTRGTERRVEYTDQLDNILYTYFISPSEKKITVEGKSILININSSKTVAILFGSEYIGKDLKELVIKINDTLKNILDFDNAKGI